MKKALVAGVIAAACLILGSCAADDMLPSACLLYTSQQLWAKLISGAFWTVISGAGVIVSFGLLFGGIIQAAGNYTGENIFAYITTSIEYIL